MTTYINCNRDDISTGIRYEAESNNCQSVEFVGSYEHPEHPGSADWTIYLYKLTTKEGWTVWGAATNGDPVWQEEDGQAWAELMAEYEIEDDYTYEVREGLYYKLTRRIGQEDYYYATDENDNRISIDRPDVDGDWTSDTTGKSFAFLP